MIENGRTPSSGQPGRGQSRQSDASSAQPNGFPFAFSEQSFDSAAAIVRDAVQGPPGLQRRADKAVIETAVKEVAALSVQIGIEEQSRELAEVLSGTEGPSERLTALSAERIAWIRQLAEIGSRYPVLQAELTGEIEQTQAEAEGRGRELRLGAEVIAVELNSALRGFSKNLATIKWLLEDRDPALIEMIRGAYELRYGSGEAFMNRALAVVQQPLGLLSSTKQQPAAALDQALQKCRKWQRPIAAALLTQDKAVIAADGLYLALRAKDEAQLEAALKKINRLDSGCSRDAVVEAFAERWCGPLKVASVEAAIEKRFKRGTRERLQALWEGAEARAAALALQDACPSRRRGSEYRGKVDWGAVNQVLTEHDLSRVGALMDELQALNGVDLAELVAQRLGRDPGNPLIQEAYARLVGDDLLRDAALLRARVIKLDPTWIGESFLNKNAEQRLELVGAYTEVFGRDCWSDLKSRLKGVRFQLMESLIHEGRLSKAEILRDCMFGFGADEEGICQVLSGVSKEEFAEIEQEYSEKFQTLRCFTGRFSLLGAAKRSGVFVYELGATTVDWLVDRGGEHNTWKECFRKRNLIGRSLRDDLSWELDGDEKWDVERSLQGPPQNAEQAYEQIAGLYKAERAGLATALLNGVTSEGRILNEVHRKAAAYTVKVTQAGRLATPQELQHLETHAKLMKVSADSFRKTKRAVAEFAANLVSVGACIIATGNVLTAESSWSMYTAAAVVTAAVSLATRYGTKVLLKGHRSYDLFREGAVDLPWAIVDGATLYFARLARVMGPMASKLMKTPAAKRMAARFARVFAKVLKGVAKAAAKRAARVTRDVNEGRHCQYLAYTSADPLRLKPPAAITDDFDDVLVRLSGLI